MYTLAVARRYLRCRPISWIACVIIVMIVVLYLLIIAVLEGFKEHYMDKLRSITAHMSVRVGNVPWGIVKPEAWAKMLEKMEGIEGATIGTETPMIVQFDQSRTLGTLRGIDLKRELRYGKLGSVLQLTNERSNVKSETAEGPASAPEQNGAKAPPGFKEFGEHAYGGKGLQGCIIGDAWRRAFDLRIGGIATFLFMDDRGDPRSIPFFIIGFFGGNSDYLENAAYVDQQLLAKEMLMPGTAKTISLWVKGNPDRPDLKTIRDRVRAAMFKVLKEDPYIQQQNQLMPDDKKLEDMLTVETWQEKDRNLYFAISRENLIMRIIMAVFLVFVAIIIFLILGRLVAEKIRDIGALRAMGATPCGILFCFLLQSLIIAFCGLGLGLPAAILFVKYINEIEHGVAGTLGGFFGGNWHIFPEGWFLLDKIPTNLLFSDILVIVLMTLMASIFGALIPAWQAARLNPVECLRHE